MRSIRRKHRSKKAISEVIGGILLLAVTIAIGFATWAWANGSAANSELNYGNAVASNMNYLNERYIIANANFPSGNYQQFTLWFYNNGNTTVYITTVWVSNSTGLVQTFNQTSTSTGPNCKNCLEVPVGNVVSITLSLSTKMTVGSTYTFKSLGEYGQTYSYEQTR